MNITLPDGASIELEDNSTILDAAKKISNSLAKKAVAGVINNKLVDLNTALHNGDNIKILTESDEEALEILRHSTAHLMAQAVLRLYPETKVTIGPVVENGFYYDFDRDTPFTVEDLEKIEKEMAKISAENILITRKEISAGEAVDRFTKEDEKYKVEIIKDLGVNTVSLYEQGDFTDLCRGPHVSSTGKIKHFKLLSVAGAYWREINSSKEYMALHGFLKKNLMTILICLKKQKNATTDALANN